MERHVLPGSLFESDLLLDVISLVELKEENKEGNGDFEDLQILKSKRNIELVVLNKDGTYPPVGGID